VQRQLRILTQLVLYSHLPSTIYGGTPMKSPGRPAFWIVCLLLLALMAGCGANQNSGTQDSSADCAGECSITPFLVGPDTMVTDMVGPDTMTVTKVDCTLTVSWTALPVGPDTMEIPVGTYYSVVLRKK
jgi:hypothetical protein